MLFVSKFMLNRAPFKPASPNWAPLSKYCLNKKKNLKIKDGIVIKKNYFALDLPYIPCSLRVFNRFLTGRWAFVQCLDQILILLFSLNIRKRIIPVAC